jgi:hypothetical protein
MPHTLSFPFIAVNRSPLTCRCHVRMSIDRIRLGRWKTQEFSPCRSGIETSAVGYLRARLAGRARERFYLIHMIDDATGELTARFVSQDSTEENMRVLKTYLEANALPKLCQAQRCESHWHRAPE